MNINIGGQAVIEGVMMSSPHYFAVALRSQDGEIVVKKAAKSKWAERLFFSKVPLLRGVFVLFDTLVIGIKSLTYSAGVFSRENIDKDNNRRGEEFKFNPWMLAGTVIFSLVAGFFLFFVLPLGITEYLRRSVLTFESPFLFNLVDGAIRISIFLLYILAISLLKDIQRIFQYHGAEHKVAYAYEAGSELKLENARKYNILHPRCGTSFLLVVMVLAIFVFSLFQPATILGKFLMRLALLPLIAGIAYETIKLLARFRTHTLVKFLITPNLWLQRLTTREPSEGQIEVALAALQGVLEAEKGESDAIH
ncbi:MAG: DUF1385 domain-containing protein [Elusimicrobiota bacterium]|nr:DUF1385 domain-containing protein [Elusimicrobiota bacterium]